MLASSQGKVGGREVDALLSPQLGFMTKFRLRSSTCIVLSNANWDPDQLIGRRVGPKTETYEDHRIVGSDAK